MLLRMRIGAKGLHDAPQQLHSLQFQRVQALHANTRNLVELLVQIQLVTGLPGHEYPAGDSRRSHWTSSLTHGHALYLSKT